MMRLFASSEMRFRSASRHETTPKPHPPNRAPRTNTGGALGRACGAADHRGVCLRTGLKVYANMSIESLPVFTDPAAKLWADCRDRGHRAVQRHGQIHDQVQKGGNGDCPDPAPGEQRGQYAVVQIRVEGKAAVGEEPRSGLDVRLTNERPQGSGRSPGYDEKAAIMIKLGAIEFDDRIFDALRDDKLVVFAGAGVSMAPPSNLASFRKLTSDIAQGTGFEPTPTEQLDRFLGQLHHRKVAVHERAAQLLSPAGSAPNTLHQDLLRLFRTVERVRLVTTNFDLHFETAASTLFGSTPEVYRAPALPLGYDFTGIVHVHGALPRARDLVLTDADFGRAYLTEGWGRRFLVDVFREFTVLFVGYMLALTEN